MAKPKHGAAKRSGKQAKSSAKPAKARPAKKAAAKPTRKSAVKTVHKAPAKVAKAVKKPARTATKAVKKASPKTAPSSTIKNKSKIPAVKKAAPAKKHNHTPAPKKSAATHASTAEHDTSRAAHHPVRKQHAKPVGGVAARLSVGAAAEQTITREDGRYALPASVNIELPKGYRPSPKEEYMNP
jgi:DnaK suppressor protein